MFLPQECYDFPHAKMAGMLISVDIRAGGRLQTGLGHREGLYPRTILHWATPLEASFAGICLCELAGSKPESGIGSQSSPE